MFCRSRVQLTSRSSSRWPQTFAFLGKCCIPNHEDDGRRKLFGIQTRLSAGRREWEARRREGAHSTNYSHGIDAFFSQPARLAGNTSAHQEILPDTAGTLGRVFGAIVGALQVCPELSPANVRSAPTSGEAPRWFTSSHGLEGLGRRLNPKPISGEQELEAYERFAVE
ncbi:hypothetical protein N7451_012480 [Penicillium sp. IBT 35674x]|nr:hypothetical protein N7451_012480 [Penicillium sp. IBT 35674x]